MNHTGNKNIEHKPKQYNDSKHHDSQGSCNICAIQLLYWAPQTYRTRRNTIVILGTTLAQHKNKRVDLYQSRIPRRTFEDAV